MSSYVNWKSDNAGSSGGRVVRPNDGGLDVKKFRDGWFVVGAAAYNVKRWND